MGQDIDRAGRVRAARAIARMTQPELGAALNTSGQTIKRIENGEKTPDLDDLRRIADACSVPRWFMEHGWDGWREVRESEDPATGRRLDRLERALADAGLLRDERTS